MSEITDARLRHLANVKRGLDDLHDVGYYESCAIAEELLVLRAEVEALKQTNAGLNVEVSRLYACRNELQDVTQAMDDPSVNNARALEDAIHAMKADNQRLRAELVQANDANAACNRHHLELLNEIQRLCELLKRARRVIFKGVEDETIIEDITAALGK